MSLTDLAYLVKQTSVPLFTDKSYPLNLLLGEYFTLTNQVSDICY